MDTSNKEFHFGLLRISMIQLLKSQGFDKASVVILDAYTDLYVRFLQLLTLEVMRLSRSRMDEYEDVALQDISQALLNVGLLKPMNILDVYDENPDLLSDMGMQRFKNWCLQNTMPQEARAVATPTADLLRSKDKASKPLSMIPEYINQLDKGTDKIRSDHIARKDETVDQMISSGDMDDWVRFLLRKQQLQFAAKGSAREIKDLNALPPLPGLKNSVLSRAYAPEANEITPELYDADNEERVRKHNMLLSKMVVDHKGMRLENIRLSFEDEDLRSSEPGVNIDDVGFVDDEANEDIEEIERFEGNLGLSFDGDSANLQLAEANSLTDTFQRRDSLDFGDDVFQRTEFDFNTF
ncbi:LADA_0A06810g1_1 [Lachancea dasiensis]|uniref:LADA_0A06810g1_1 n=1 Tax=Lachancea dasiensis TaxID=1072105 RepID=A0A1G4IPK7_9SACH|nr:LADA_0A06810g1_1 [Lachancea dasiensis]